MLPKIPLPHNKTHICTSKTKQKGIKNYIVEKCNRKCNFLQLSESKLILSVIKKKSEAIERFKLTHFFGAAKKIR